MKTVVKVLAILAVISLLAGCNERLEKTDGGGVTLSVSDFDELPTQVSIGAVRFTGQVTVGEITIESIVKDVLNGASSDLMNVEMESYEVVYSRGDGGTRVPPPLVNKIFGVTPAGGTNTYNNLPILGFEQINEQPLSDLFIENGGFDSETGRASINLNLTIRFFGRTVSGEAVDTPPTSFTVVFVA